jgi:hypothetical protein
MKEGTITKDDLDRIVKAVEHEMKIKPVEQPRVVVKDIESESDDAHMVNLDDLHCSCSDFKYNCPENVYCKHILHVIFKKHGMI